MSKIILINPVIGSDYKKDSKKIGETRLPIPMGIFCIGSYLKSKRENVSIIDANAYNQIGKDYISMIKDQLKDAKFVGFSVMSDSIKNSLELSKLIKKINPKIKIVWGGIHPTLYPKQCCENKLIDYVVMYEGEETFFDLVKNKKVRNIDGLVYKEKSKVIINKPRKLMDINKSPYSRWDLLDMQLYLEVPYPFIYGDNRKVINQLYK